MGEGSLLFVNLMILHNIAFFESLKVPIISDFSCLAFA
nr:MAG TPA: hypothetical protein [Caudoviricetes sp.]